MTKAMPAERTTSSASSVAGEIEKSERTTVPSRSVTTASILTGSMIPQGRLGGVAVGASYRDPMPSGEVERRGRDAGVCLRTNPGVDQERGTTVEEHFLGGRQLPLGDLVLAVADCVIDHGAASLASEILKRDPI